MFRTILIALMLSLGFQAQSQNTWQFQAPYPTPHTLNSVQFLDTLSGWAVGDFGTLLHTTDGGRSWVRHEAVDDSSFIKVQFLNAQLGWAGGLKGMVRTVDGGQTWERLNRSGATNFHFSDANRGFRVFADIASSTTDGGRTWTANARIRSSTAIKEIKFASATTGWVATDTASLGFTVYRTTNRGGIWRTVLHGAGRVSGASFFDANRGVVVVEKQFTSSVYHTADAGQNWREISLGSGSYTEAQFIDPRHGWRETYTGLLDYTSDSGRSWRGNYITNEPGLSPKSFFFLDTLNGWYACSKGTVLRTANGGRTWARRTAQERTTMYNVYDVQMLSDRVGYAAAGLRVLKTTDGGLNWVPLPATTTTLTHFDLHFLNENLGWTVGEGGLIKKTTDGGLNWTEQTSPATGLNSVYFADADTGYALAPGMLIRTVDGGQTWAQTAGFAPPSGMYFTSMQFLNSRMGWVVGSRGQVYRTQDGGLTWEQQGTHTLRTLEGVFFLDENRGWIAGSSNGFLRTQDGGQTWTSARRDSSSNTALRHYMTAVAFSDSLNGYCVGKRGSLCRSTDGGRTWVDQLRPLDDELKCIYLLDAANVWVGGLRTILKLGDLPVANRPIVAAPEAATGLGQIAPNPSQGIFYLDLEKPARVDVHTLDGRRVLSISGLRAGRHPIDLSWHGKGLYLVTLTAPDGRRQVRKAVVE